MDTIKSIPGEEEGGEPFWEQSENCAGFIVGDDCEWRYEEMELISFTPVECLEDKSLACDQIVSYARF